ncbi:MAG: hypothetical protein E6649_16190 [Paeniclostridium sordellii]|nr:hypothetical protein [Paeniclostridium sordellii]
MKNSIIIGLVAIGIISTSSITFADNIKILKKDGVDYIPVKKVIQKSGGKLDISDNTAKLSINGKSIILEKDFSFAKFNDKYYPLYTKELNGVEVPVDNKPIFKKDEVYIEKNFLKDYKITKYKIEKDNVKIILDDDKKYEQNIEKEKKEENDKLDNTRLSNDLKQENEIAEIKQEKKVKKPSRSTNFEKTPVKSKPNTIISSNNDNHLEDDKKDTEKATGETKTEEIKQDNQQNELSKPEVPSEQQPQGQLE